MASHGRSKIRQEWFCAGCQKMHSKYQRDIEGENHSGYWCAHSIRQGIKARLNDLPEYDATMVQRAAQLAAGITR